MEVCLNRAVKTPANVRSRNTCAAAAAALVGSSALACGSAYEPGIRVALISQQSSSAPFELSTAAGGVKIEELRWASSEVELRLCPSALARARAWLLPCAQAHGVSSPTLLAVPTIVSGTAAAVQLGELTPPPGHYCSVRYRIAPADADAVGLAAAPLMLGASFRVRGELQPRDGVPSDWALTSQRSFDVTRDIDLELSSDHLQASLRLGLDAQRWREQIGVGWFEAVAREDALLVAFRDAFQVEVE
jgi:hypothetical protein